MPLKRLPPVPPGEGLLEELLTSLGISQYQLAKDISVPRGASTRSLTASAR